MILAGVFGDYRKAAYPDFLNDQRRSNAVYYYELLDVSIDVKYLSSQS